MNPLRVLICTFSQTGSTAKVAGKIAEGLTTSGMKVSMHSILSRSIPDINQYDAIGIGCPVYVFRPPFPVEDFIRALPDMKKKYFFTFVQYGTNPGAAGNIIRRLLRKKHAVDTGYLTTRGEDYFIGYLKRGYLFSAGFPGDFELQTAMEFGYTVAHRIADGITSLEPFDPPTHSVYAIERASMSRMNAKLYLSRMFTVSKACNGCGICIEKCPVNNLREGKNKKPVWGSNCILCATCQIKCPLEAIKSPYDWAMNAPFINYNINRALRHNTPYAKVIFGKGRMVRV